MNRHELRDAFLSQQGINPKAATLIAGDASYRKYFRLNEGNRPTLLMDADPNKGEDIRPFMTIAQHLLDHGFSAPEIYGFDETQGFMLIEDFGDALFARILEEKPQDDTMLYQAAIDALLKLNTCPSPKLEPYAEPKLTEYAMLSWDWYRAALVGTDDDLAREAFSTALSDLFQSLPAPSTLVLRDYHVENLIWLPNREGHQKVGLLDFQDAMLGHPAYDLVSILQDARRDVPRKLESTMLEYAVSRTGIARDSFEQDYHILGLQRNLRILGVFVRLWKRDNKPGYLDYLPRVWGHIRHNLERLANPKFRTLIREQFKAPSADVIETIRHGQP